MSRHWVRNKETDALERNSSSHGIPARSDIMSLEVKKKKRQLSMNTCTFLLKSNTSTGKKQLASTTHTTPLRLIKL